MVRKIYLPTDLLMVFFFSDYLTHLPCVAPHGICRRKNAPLRPVIPAICGTGGWPALGVFPTILRIYQNPLKTGEGTSGLGGFQGAVWGRKFGGRMIWRGKYFGEGRVEKGRGHNGGHVEVRGWWGGTQCFTYKLDKQKYQRTRVAFHLLFHFASILYIYFYAFTKLPPSKRLKYQLFNIKMEGA